MRKPNNFDNVQAFTGFEALTPGGHICNIYAVEETQSRAGKDMIVIYLDTDKTDSQPNYYSTAFKNDKRENRKWNNNAIVRQLVLDADGNANRGFKTFIEMVKKCNPGFNENVLWGNEPINKFLKGKLIGALFGEEEYLNGYGESKFACKFQAFRTLEEVKKGIEAPERKMLNPGNDKTANTGANNFDDNQWAIEDGGEMPF